MVVAVVGGDVSDLGDDVGPEAARQRMAHSRVDGESGAGDDRVELPGCGGIDEFVPVAVHDRGRAGDGGECGSSVGCGVDGGELAFCVLRRRGRRWRGLPGGRWWPAIDLLRVSDGGRSLEVSGTHTFWARLRSWWAMARSFTDVRHVRAAGPKVAPRKAWQAGRTDVWGRVGGQ